MMMIQPSIARIREWGTFERDEFLLFFVGGGLFGLHLLYYIWLKLIIQLVSRFIHWELNVFEIQLGVFYSFV